METFNSSAMQVSEEAVVIVDVVKQRRPRLDPTEARLMEAYRALRAAESRPPVVPDALLKHGFVSKNQAAKLLKVKPKDIVAMAKADRWADRLPTYCGGLFAISELRRQFERRHLKRVEELAKATVQHVTTDTIRHWATWNIFDDELRELRDLLSPEEAAKALGVSKAKLDRLDIASTRHSAVRGVVYTRQEVDAYKRKLAAQGKAVQS